MPSKLFSGKQKKEQLKQKRAKKSGQQDSDSDEGRRHAPEPAHGGGDNATLGGDKKGIRSAFKKESDKEVKARKRLSYLPLTDRRVGNPAIPFGEWFKMAIEGTIDSDEDSDEDVFQRHARLAEKRATQQRGTQQDDDGKAHKPVYEWRDAPICLPVPLPANEFDVVAPVAKPARAAKGGQQSKQQPHAEEKDTVVDAYKAAEEVQFAAWLSAMDREGNKPNAGGINSYERNLDVWRQLWFTVEHSDVVMLIADARYPIFHVPLSLARFVIFSRRRKLLVVLNKSDLVPQQVLQEWTTFLRTWITAFLHNQGMKEVDGMFDIVSVCAMPDRFDADMKDETTAKFGSRRRKINTVNRKMQNYRDLAQELGAHDEEDEEHSNGSDHSSDSDDGRPNAVGNFKGAKNAMRDEVEFAKVTKERTEKLAAVGVAINYLLDCCHRLGAKGTHPGEARKDASAATPILGIGLIGHPNVGKSSLINAIKGVKTVSVSATPGHTKHMQTVNLLEDNIILYDCPGLCFPLLGVPKPLQAVLGTHQIAQQRDPTSGVAFLARHLSLERMYGLKKLYDDEEHWSAHELCEAYAVKRGYRTRGKGGGAPDVHRGAIAILQEAYAGRLVLFFVPPPLEKAKELAAFCDRNIEINVPALIVRPNPEADGAAAQAPQSAPNRRGRGHGKAKEAAVHEDEQDDDHDAHDSD
jgi:ribosome biogenesis GTPase A